MAAAQQLLLPAVDLHPPPDWSLRRRDPRPRRQRSREPEALRREGHHAVHRGRVHGEGQDRPADELHPSVAGGDPEGPRRKPWRGSHRTHGRCRRDAPAARRLRLQHDAPLVAGLRLPLAAAEPGHLWRPDPEPDSAEDGPGLPQQRAGRLAGHRELAGHRRAVVHPARRGRGRGPGQPPHAGDRRVDAVSHRGSGEVSQAAGPERGCPQRAGALLQDSRPHAAGSEPHAPRQRRHHDAGGGRLRHAGDAGGHLRGQQAGGHPASRQHRRQRHEPGADAALAGRRRVRRAPGRLPGWLPGAQRDAAAERQHPCHGGRGEAGGGGGQDVDHSEGAQHGHRRESGRHHDAGLPGN
mmetsp:Transcript_100981/g.218055  ORF Transcript_100981/g.218055 Transcript_100981/m.218055 type:complete len:353 (-) Transcript_100981:1901-2959(-)